MTVPVDNGLSPESDSVGQESDGVGQESGIYRVPEVTGSSPEPDPSASSRCPAHRIRSARTPILLLGLVLPTTAALIGLVLIVIWLPSLPDPVAIHWPAGGKANGFGSIVTYLVLLPVTVIPFCALMTLMAWHYTLDSIDSGFTRILVAVSVFFGIFLSVSLTGSVAFQRGLAEASEAGDPALILLFGATAAAVLAGMSWFLLPNPAIDAGRSVAVRGQAPQADLSSFAQMGVGRPLWTRTTSAPWWVATLVVVVIPVAMILFGLAADVAAMFPTVVVVGVVVLLVGLPMFHWQVAIGVHRVTVRSVIGFPRFIVPISNVTEARVVSVRAMREFGGWGLRFSPDGRLGIILRSGEALEVTRVRGRPIVVTVGDAKTAAGLINALRAEVNGEQSTAR